jgi:hypothetical protein
LYTNVPLDEFVVFTDGIWPQLYWDTFNNPANINGYANSGYPTGPGGMTGEFLIDATQQILARYGREVIPVGQGASADPYMWDRFNYRAFQHGMPQVSVWRYGVTQQRTFEYFRANPAGRQPVQPATPTPGPAPQRTSTPTQTAKPTKTARPTRTATQTPTRTPRPTRTPTGTSTPAPSVTSAPSATATP